MFPVLLIGKVINPGNLTRNTQLKGADRLTVLNELCPMQISVDYRRCVTGYTTSLKKKKKKKTDKDNPVSPE